VVVYVCFFFKMGKDCVRRYFPYNPHAFFFPRRTILFCSFFFFYLRPISALAGTAIGSRGRQFLRFFCNEKKKKKNVGGLYIGITRNALSLHYRNIRRPDNVVNDRCKSSAVITAKKKKKTKECRYKRIRNIARSIADGRRRPSYSRH
jgi:hypothetical protein